MADETGTAIGPYYARLVARATETAIDLLGPSRIEAERDAARRTPLDDIAAEALRIAADLAAGA